MIKITTPDINRHLHRHKGVRTYLHDQYRYEKYFIGECYLCCDLTKKMQMVISGLSVVQMTSSKHRDIWWDLLTSTALSCVISRRLKRR
jgi:hypothetical protein